MVACSAVMCVSIVGLLCVKGLTNQWPPIEQQYPGLHDPTPGPHFLFFSAGGFFQCRGSSICLDWNLRGPMAGGASSCAGLTAPKSVRACFPPRILRGATLAEECVARPAMVRSATVFDIRGSFIFLIVCRTRASWTGICCQGGRRQGAGWGRN